MNTEYAEFESFGKEVKRIIPIWDDLDYVDQLKLYDLFRADKIDETEIEDRLESEYDRGYNSGYEEGLDELNSNQDTDLDEAYTIGYNEGKEGKEKRSYYYKD